MTFALLSFDYRYGHRAGTGTNDEPNNEQRAKETTQILIESVVCFPPFKVARLPYGTQKRLNQYQIFAVAPSPQCKALVRLSPHVQVFRAPIKAGVLGEVCDEADWPVDWENHVPVL